jgi:hypothetical protein
MTRHQLDPSPSTTADVFSRDLRPVLTVDPGDTIVLRSLDASGHLQPQTFPGEKVPAMFSEWRGHCLTGPIEVRGAGIWLSPFSAGLVPAVQARAGERGAALARHARARARCHSCE